MTIAPILGKIFVLGLAIVEGSIQIDPEAESFPGDLLHEAGHIAVCAPELRRYLLRSTVIGLVLSGRI